MKNVAAATRKMIGFYHGNRHDIAHFLKVWAMAKTIGELEGLDGHTQEVLELAAVVHDIACRCAGRNTAIPTASIRSWRARRWWRHSLPICPSAARTWTASAGWLRTTIPIRTWTARTTGSCSRRISSSTRMRGACARPAIEAARERVFPDPFRDPPARYDLFGITDAAPARLPGRALSLDPRRFSSNFGADRAFSVLKRIRGGARIPLKKRSGAGQACGGFFVPRWLEISN